MQYRTALYGAFVIDRNGVIVARDGSSYSYDSTGRMIQGDLNPLPFETIAGILASLIEDEL